MSEELNTPIPLSCPFCGNTDIKIRGNGTGEYYCECGGGLDHEGVGCRARSNDHRSDNPQTAVERWNRRVASSALLSGRGSDEKTTSADLEDGIANEIYLHPAWKGRHQDAFELARSLVALVVSKSCHDR